MDAGDALAQQNRRLALVKQRCLADKPYWRREETQYGVFGQRFRPLPLRSSCDKCGAPSPALLAAWDLARRRQLASGGGAGCRCCCSVPCCERGQDIELELGTWRRATPLLLKEHATTGTQTDCSVETQTQATPTAEAAALQESSEPPQRARNSQGPGQGGEWHESSRREEQKQQGQHQHQHQHQNQEPRRQRPVRRIQVPRSRSHLRLSNRTTLHVSPTGSVDIQIHEDEDNHDHDLDHDFDHDHAAPPGLSARSGGDFFEEDSSQSFTDAEVLKLQRLVQRRHERLFPGASTSA